MFTNRSRWTIFDLFLHFVDVDWLVVFLFIFITFSMFNMKILLMLFFYNFVYKSITLDHFWDFSLFESLIDVQWFVNDFDSFFDFQNEIAFDAFLLNFVYKSITLDHVWDFSHVFGFWLMFNEIWLIFIHFHWFLMRCYSLGGYKIKFRLMLFFLNFVYKSITLDHFWDVSTVLRFWLMFNDLWMILIDLLIFKLKFLLMLFF